MILSVRTRLFLAGAALVLLTTACQPVTLVGTGTSATVPCYAGTWTLDGEQILKPLATQLGNVTVTPQTSSLTLSLVSDGTWAFSGTQIVGVSGASPFGHLDGTVTVTDVHASGTYLDRGSNELDFTLTSLTATASFDGTVNGNPVRYAISLPGGGDELDGLYGLAGAATYSCSVSPPTLSLTFTSFRLEF